MKIERRHLELIAGIIHSLPDGPVTRQDVAELFAERLAEHNGNFKPDKFMQAAGALPAGGQNAEAN